MEKELRQCTKCKKWKPIDDFPIDKRAKNPARRKRCIVCSKPAYIEPDISRIRRLNNQEAYLLTSAKQRAKRKELDLNIDLDDISIPSHCPLLGIELVMSGDPSHYNSPTLDRIDPSKGYVKGNVWVISKRANCIKTNATLAEISKVAKGLLALHERNAEAQTTLPATGVTHLRTKSLITASQQLNLTGEKTLIDFSHAIKKLYNLSARNERKVSQIKRGIAECLAIAKASSILATAEDSLSDNFLRIRIDGLIMGGEKEIICSPGKTRYDSFAVTDTGKPLRGERGLSAVMERLRKDIHALLRSYGIKKFKELKNNRGA